MIELDQQGSNKIQISEHANVAPNKCANCSFSGREPGRYFIDFGVDLEFYGTVYLCTSCFAECANIIGWISPAEADRLKLRDAELTDEITRLKEFETKYVSDVVAETNVLTSPIESGSIDSDAAGLLGTPTKSTTKRGSSHVPESASDESGSPLSL
jgi:hypothetical protein